jgi:hypothetical protein
MKVTKAETSAVRQLRLARDAEWTPDTPGYSLTYLTFSDGTEWAIELDSGGPETYAHKLLDDFIKAGGKVDGGAS